MHVKIDLQYEPDVVYDRNQLSGLLIPFLQTHIIHSVTDILQKQNLHLQIDNGKLLTQTLP